MELGGLGYLTHATARNALHAVGPGGEPSTPPKANPLWAH